MKTPLPGPGGVLSLERTLASAPDPLALYRHLTGDAPDTLLLESLDASTKEAERSFLVTRAALRADCRGRTVTIRALGGNGAAALPHLADRLRARAESVDQNADGLVAVFPPSPTEASEEARLHAPTPLDALRALATGWTRLGQTHPYAVLTAGVFSYDFLGTFERLPDEQADPLGFPDFQFWLPDRVIALDHRRGTATLLALVVGGEGAEERYHDASAAIAALTEAVERCPTPNPPPPAPEATPPVPDLSDDRFGDLVLRCKEHITRGDVFQIVPSRTFSTPCADALAAYARLRALNPSPYMFYVRGPDHTVLGASPETALKVSGSPKTVEIRPIAGTAARGRHADGRIDADLDGRIETRLRLDEKELAEHMMLIDLARNDVARVSVPGTRHAPAILTVDRYHHVMHLVSYVEGRLRDDLDALHAYAASMNMGTVVGAPKIRAATLLRRYEATRRGPYGGAVGYLTSDGEMDSALVIRTAVVTDGRAYVRAGAGVVHDSDPAGETLETQRKAQAVLDALGRAAETRSEDRDA
ncbi:MAG: anthranilate synthase component 1 [Bacteroidota bacterium]